MIIRKCKGCGKDTEFHNHIGDYCPTCRAKRRKEQAKKSYEKNKEKYRLRDKERYRQEKEKNKVKETKAHLNDSNKIEREADAAGMTYGKYVLWIERGIKL